MKQNNDYSFHRIVFTNLNAINNNKKYLIDLQKKIKEEINNLC